MEDKIMVIEKVEELFDDKGNLLGRLVTDKAGNELRVKKGGRGGKLQDRWGELDNGIGKAFRFKMAMFTPPGKTESFPYPTDFEEVKGVFEKQAAEKVADETRDIKRASIEAQVALYCAKDIGVAILQQGGQTSPQDILNDAGVFYAWLQGGTQIEIKKGTPLQAKPRPVIKDGDAVITCLTADEIEQLEEGGIEPPDKNLATKQQLAEIEHFRNTDKDFFEAVILRLGLKDKKPSQLTSDEVTHLLSKFSP